MIQYCCKCLQAAGETLIFTFATFFDLSLYVCDVYHLLQEFFDPRDAEDAQKYCDGKDVEGGRIVVEFARGPVRIFIPQ